MINAVGSAVQRPSPQAVNEQVNQRSPTTSAEEIKQIVEAAREKSTEGVDKNNSLAQTQVVQSTKEVLEERLGNTGQGSGPERLGSIIDVLA